MHIETPRLLLRDFTMEDLPNLWEIFGDDITMEHMHPYTAEETKEFLRTFCVERTPPGAYAAALKEGGRVIGYLLCSQIDAPGIYELGLGVPPRLLAAGLRRRGGPRLDGPSVSCGKRPQAGSGDGGRGAVRPLPGKAGLAAGGHLPQAQPGAGRPGGGTCTGTALLREDFSPAVGPSKEEDVPAVIDLLRRRIAWMDEKGPVPVE